MGSPIRELIARLSGDDGLELPALQERCRELLMQMRSERRVDGPLA